MTRSSDEIRSDTVRASQGWRTSMACQSNFLIHASVKQSKAPGPPTVARIRKGEIGNGDKPMCMIWRAAREPQTHKVSRWAWLGWICWILVMIKGSHSCQIWGGLTIVPCTRCRYTKFSGPWPTPLPLIWTSVQWQVEWGKAKRKTFWSSSPQC